MITGLLKENVPFLQVFFRLRPCCRICLNVGTMQKYWQLSVPKPAWLLGGLHSRGAPLGPVLLGEEDAGLVGLSSATAGLG